MFKKVCLALAFASAGFAAQIVGALSLNGIGMAQDDVNLAVSTIFTSTATTVSSAGSGDYAPIPIGDDFGPQTIDLTNLASFILFDAGSPGPNPPFGNFGNFVASSGLIVTRTANFLDIFIVGVFTPVVLGGGTLDPTVSSIRISINQSGSAISEAITLNSPALDAPIPEPATMILFGGGLAGIGLLGRKRFAR